MPPGTLQLFSTRAPWKPGVRLCLQPQISTWRTVPPPEFLRTPLCKAGARGVPPYAPYVSLFIFQRFFGVPSF